MFKKLFLILCLFGFAFAQTKFSDPKPSFESPRKVVYSLYVNDLDTVNHTIGSMYNILKEYPAESLKIVVVASFAFKAVATTNDSIVIFFTFIIFPSYNFHMNK